MITVKELREQLANIPDDTPIILQTDDEGNGYRYVNGIDFAPPTDDDANYFNGDDCVRKSDIDDEWRDAGEYDKLVAVVY